jgi:hypothetical protein
LDDDLVAKIQREIDLGYGDNRLRFILNWVKSGRPLFECDKRYLARHLVHYAESEAKEHEKFGKPTTKLGHQFKKIEENIRDDRAARRAFKDQTDLTSDATETNSEPPVNQVDVVVQMRKDLHHILIKLDELEERFRRQTQHQEPRRDVKRREVPSTVYDVPQEKPRPISYTSQEDLSNILNATERPIVKTEETRSIKGVRTDIRKLRALATVLFCVTIVTIGALFAITTVFGIPLGREKLEQLGITYDQFKSMFNWLVPMLVVYLGAWAAFGILYLQSIKKK